MKNHNNLSAPLRIVVASLFLCFALSTIAEEIDREHREWLIGKMNIVETVKAGASAERLLELFEPERGVTKIIAEGASVWHPTLRGDPNELANKGAKFDRTAWVFRLKSFPLIKIDVQFVEPIISAYDAKSTYKIKWISKPYLERPNIG